MAKINLEDYTIALDNYNASVYYNYVGKKKDSEEEVEKSKLIGYYNRSIASGCFQALDAIIAHGLSTQAEMSVNELKEFITLQKDDVISWIKEEWN